MNIDNIRRNSGLDPLDTSAQRNVPAAIGNPPAAQATAPASPGGIQEGATATGPGNQKLVYRSGKWVPQ